MVNGNDLLEYEENNIETLTEEFIKQYKDLWDSFVMDSFNNHGR